MRTTQVLPDCARVRSCSWLALLLVAAGVARGEFFIVGSGPSGDGAVRCAYLGDGARLEGFTLTNGHTRTGGYLHTEQTGGGAWCESTAVVSNCTLSGNSANGQGGGAYHGALQNCTVYENAASTSGANEYGSAVAYSCITPDPGGTGNVTNEPHFVNASASNFHLLVTSPCIDRGSSQAWMATATDLDGNPRIQNGVVDMGAYEFVTGLADSDGDGIDDDWELQYFPTLSSLSFDADADGDGFRDGFEFRAGTSPTNAASYLGIMSVTVEAVRNEVLIRWASESNKLYSLHGTSNLVHGLDVLLDEHIPADPPENVYTHPAGGVDGRWYGVEVEIQP